MAMTEYERYLFDLQGYLVVPGVLSRAEVDELNAALDERDVWNTEWDEAFWNVQHLGDGYLAIDHLHRWEAPFRRLIEQRVVLEYLSELVSPKLRFDQSQASFMKPGAPGLRLHGGGEHGGYEVRRDVINAGLCVAAYALCDAGVAEGGFAAVPGSHKANFAFPSEMAAWENFEQFPHIQRIPVAAGDVVLFTETLSHGAWPWRASYERRTLFYRYHRGDTVFELPMPRVEDVPDAEWSDTARRLMAPPYSWDYTRGANGNETERPDVLG